MKKVVVGIQARINSSRLPGKVLLKLGEKPLIERIFNTASAVADVAQTFVLTGSPENNHELIEFCRKRSIPVMDGDDEDVLSRYAKLQTLTQADILVRLTADNPLVPAQLISDVIKILISDNTVQYGSNCLYQDYPLGLNVEAFTSQSLGLLLNNPTLEEKEHVTIRFKKQSQLFRVSHLKASQMLHWPDLRLTVDEMEDYAFLRELYDRLSSKIWDISFLLGYLRSHRELVTNSYVKQKVI